ncbi:MAG: Sb-PDE family phosphodiesterase [bacterium]
MKSLRSIFLSISVIFYLVAPVAFGQEEAKWKVYREERHEIAIPDILGYKTVKCDFHTHTVFSDGEVWPTVRVEEAWREGLDAIAITDHIEYQPHREDVPTNHNRPYEIAFPQAKRRNILLVKGAEITRETPPGHFNAIFVEDIKELDTELLEDSVRAANKQGAFVFWNHPGWKGPELGRWGEVQTTLYQNTWMRGIEICNGDVYYPEAHQWAMDKNLTMVGNSDIHDPAPESQITPAGHRTITLVFATEKTIPALKEALNAGRTTVWCENRLIGRQEYLKAIFNASFQIGPPDRTEKNTFTYRIRNDSDVSYELKRAGENGPSHIELPANTVIQMQVEVDTETERLQLDYYVDNLWIAPEKSLPVTLIFSLK